MNPYQDLPRGWMLANLDRQNKRDLLEFIDQARQWGFVPGDDLTTNPARRDWLARQRGQAWNMLAHPAGPPPSAAPAPPAAPAPRKSPKRPRRPSGQRGTITAAEVNQWLATLPAVQGA